MPMPAASTSMLIPRYVTNMSDIYNFFSTQDTSEVKILGDDEVPVAPIFAFKYPRCVNSVFFICKREHINILFF
jgi:hypothetical protein